jgi:hypothetical protein
MEVDAMAALLCLFREEWEKRHGRSVVRHHTKNYLHFMPHPDDLEAWESSEMQGLLERLQFYPHEVVLEVATLEGWWEMENWEKEWNWTPLTLFRGEEAARLFDLVAQQFVAKDIKHYKGPATRLWSEPGFPNLQNYLEVKMKDPDFEREFEARKVEVITKGCGHTGPCDCIPF